MAKKLNKYNDDKYGPRGYARLKQSAAKRKIEFDIESHEVLTDWWLTTANVCCYCGITERNFQVLIEQIKASKKKNDLLYRLKRLTQNWTVPRLSYERIDSTKGYTLDNLTKSCIICNFAKGMFIEHDEMMILGPAIHERIIKALRNKNV